MACADGLGIFLCKFNHGGIGAGPSHQTFSRGLAKGHAKTDTRHGIDQCFVDILDRLDEVRLTQDEVRIFRLFDFQRDELHFKRLLSRCCWQVFSAMGA
ncbi:hypothetical protein D3C76_1347480 [compost metagenome]